MLESKIYCGIKLHEHTLKILHKRLTEIVEVDQMHFSILTRERYN